MKSYLERYECHFLFGFDLIYNSCLLNLVIVNSGSITPIVKLKTFVTDS